ncbi:MAG TPA: hypothetical protein ENO40_07085 [Desulfurella acetivorans]|nr:hypothetical protein [Desulfurella acetivorans]
MKVLKFKCNECGKEFEINISSFNPIATFTYLNNLSSHAKTHGKEIDFTQLLNSFGVVLGFTVEYK